MTKMTKLTALMLAVSLLLCGGVLSASAEATNLVGNGGFETQDSKWAGDLTYTDEGAHSGSMCASVAATRSIYQMVDLAPETDYILTIWAKTVVANAGYLDIRFYDQNGTINNVPGYTKNSHLYQESFGTASESPEWLKHEFEFTTPKEATRASLSIKNNSQGAFYADDIALSESGMAPNYLRNGYIKAFKNGGATPAWLNPDVQGTYSTDADGSTVAQFGAAAKFGPTSVSLPSGPMVLSFDYKSDGSRGYTPQVYIKGMGSDGYRSFPYLRDKKCWQTMELYFTVPEDENGQWISDLRILTGYAKSDQNAYIKNIRIWKDESSVEYGYDVNCQCDYTTNLGGYTRGWVRKANKITDCTLSGGERTVYPKAHYVPYGTEDESFVFITGLYRVYDDGKELLEKVLMEKGETTEGRAVNVYYQSESDAKKTEGSIEYWYRKGGITVPEIGDGAGYTYEVRSFLLDSLESIRPLSAASVLR